MNFIVDVDGCAQRVTDANITQPAVRKYVRLKPIHLSCEKWELQTNEIEEWLVKCSCLCYAKTTNHSHDVNNKHKRLAERSLMLSVVNKILFFARILSFNCATLKINLNNIN